MKTLKKIFLFLISIFIPVLFAFFIGVLVVYQTLPFKWQITSEIVLDSTIYTGKYVSVCDSIRIIIESDEYGNKYDKYIVQEKLNEHWINSNIWHYVDVFDKYPKFLLYLTLQSDYEKSKKQKLITLFK